MLCFDFVASLTFGFGVISEVERVNKSNMMVWLLNGVDGGMRYLE